MFSQILSQNTVLPSLEVIGPQINEIKGELAPVVQEWMVRDQFVISRSKSSQKDQSTIFRLV